MDKKRMTKQNAKKKNCPTIPMKALNIKKNKNN